MKPNKNQEASERPFGLNAMPHVWEIVPPVSLYDNLYRCGVCGKTHMESIDNPDTKLPENGCAA